MAAVNRNEPDVTRGNKGENMPHKYGLLAGVFCLVNLVVTTGVLDIELSPPPLWWISITAPAVFFFVIWLIFLPMTIANNRALPNQGTVELLTGLGLLMPLFWLAALTLSLRRKLSSD